MQLLQVLFLSVIAAVSAFVPQSAWLVRTALASAAVDSATVVEAVPVDEREAFKIFMRMADKMLLLDVPGAGTPEMRNCCHGGCDNCPYSHVFDQMTAGRAKWVPLYDYRRLIDDRDHTSPWSAIFDSSAIAVRKEDFKSRLMLLPGKPCMGGPPGSLPPAEEPPSEHSVEELWCRIVNVLGAADEGEVELTAPQISTALQQLTQQTHGAKWSDFKKIFQ